MTETEAALERYRVTVDDLEQLEHESDSERIEAIVALAGESSRMYRAEREAAEARAALEIAEKEVGRLRDMIGAWADECNYGCNCGVCEDLRREGTPDLCPACNGTKVRGSRGQACDWCRGTGKVTE